MRNRSADWLKLKHETWSPSVSTDDRKSGKWVMLVADFVENKINTINRRLLLSPYTHQFTRYPGIFYLSLKCKTTTVILKEGYRRGKLVDPHPLTRLRDKFYHVMRTGFLYRARGLGMVSKEELLLDKPDDDGPEEEGSEEEEIVEGSELEEDSEDV